MPFRRNSNCISSLTVQSTVFWQRKMAPCRLHYLLQEVHRDCQSSLFIRPWAVMQGNTLAVIPLQGTAEKY